MRAGHPPVSAWSLTGGLILLTLFISGCLGGGGGGDGSPVGPGVETHPVWTTPLSLVQQAMATASGVAWVAGETNLTLGFSQEEVRTLCGMTADPVLLSLVSGTTGSIPAALALALSSSSTDLPRRFSWLDKDGLNWVSPVKNQGKFGTCVAIAAVAALETATRITQGQAGVPIDFSEWDLWFTGTGGKSPQPGGWFPSGAVETLRTSGVVAEEICPYTSIPQPPTIPEGTLRTSIAGWEAVAGREALKAALLKGPVLGGMRVRADFFFYRGGVYAPLVGEEIGDHALLLVGYDDDQDCWIAQNSWSSSWGENGFCRVRYGQIGEAGIRVRLAAELATGTGTATIPTTASSTTAVTATTTVTVPETPTATATVIPPATAPAVITATSTVAIPTTETVMVPPSDPTMAIGPFVREITASSAVVVWATEQEEIAQVEFGTGNTLSQVTPEGTPARTHVVRLNGLMEQTPYQFRAVTRNGAGLPAVSAPAGFTTLSAAAPLTVVPVIYGTSVRAITSQSAIISWQTDIAATSKVQYRTSTGTDTYVTDLRPLVDHAMIIKNLTGETTYTFIVRSTVIGGGEALSDPDTFQTSDITPPTYSDASATLITATSAVIVWQTDEPATTQVEYGNTTGYGWLTILDTKTTAGHRVSLTGLTAQTTYHYRLRSRDGNKNELPSADGVFTTLPVSLDTLKPVVSFASATAITATSATIVWQTDEPATTQVDYGLTEAYGLSSPLNTSLNQGHQVQLGQLRSQTTYHYRVRSRDSSNNETISTDSSFLTRDSVPPVVSDLRVSNLTANTASITFITVEPAFAVVEYGVGGLSRETDPNLVATTSFTISLTGLVTQATYQYRIRTWDPSGNLLYTTTRNFILPDTVGPVISAVLATNVSTMSALITWTTNETGTSQVEWGPASGAYTATSAFDPILVRTHSVKISGLGGTPNATWHFRVWSTDALGNRTGSDDQVFSIPLTLSGITVDAITAATATVKWDTSAAATSLVDYGLTTAYGSQAPVLPYPTDFTTTHSVTLTGLTPLATYHFRVKSGDHAGQAATSKDFTFTTPDSGTPPVLSRVTAGNVTASAAVITWVTDKDSSSVVEYGTATGSYVSRAVSNLAWSTGHRLFITGLQAGRTYYFRVMSADAAGNETVSGEFTFLTPGTTAPAISVIQVTGITGTTATVTWRTDLPATSQIDYGPSTTYVSKTAIDPVATTTHEVGLANLSPFTNYHFRVRSMNAEGLETVTLDKTFQTLDVSPPQVAEVLVQNVMATSATILWKTDESSDSQVEYGINPVLTNATVLNPLFVKIHVVSLVGLSEGTTYAFRVRSKDQFNQIGSSTVATFTTPDRTPPVVSSVDIVGPTATMATITWNTNEPATSEIEFGLTTGYGSAKPEFPYPTSATTTHTVLLSGLQSGATYHFRVRSQDVTGNLSLTKDFTLTTTDQVAPVISGLQVQGITATSATVVWSTDEASFASVTYWITGTTTTTADVGLSGTHAVTLRNLIENTTYHFAVRAQDVVGNAFTTTDDYTFSTPDLTAPTLAAGPAVAADDNSATITWTTSELANARLEYGLTTAYGSSTQTLDSYLLPHSVTVNGLSPLTTYHYRFRSQDRAGNELVSGDYSFTTQGTLLIQGIQAVIVNNTFATILCETTATATCELTHGSSNPPLVGPLGMSTPLSTTHTLTFSLQGAPRLQGSVYYFKIQAMTPTGLMKSSGVCSFAIP